MPKGILTQFIVAMHRWLADQRMVWKTGILLEKDRTTAEVIEHYGQREISIRIVGQHKKELLTIVAHELDKIHDSYRRLKVSKWIPCNCSVCKDSQDPGFYPFEVLRKFTEDRQEFIQCQKSYYMVNVWGLMDDVLDRRDISLDKEYLDHEGQIHRKEAGASKPKPEVEPEKQIFISYAWGGESEKIVNQLDVAFQAKGITIVQDKRNLGYKGRIKAFMEQIGRGKAVIVVVSEKYLKSENCMFELVQIAKNGQFYDRIFPIVLADANIYKPVARIKYIKHWEEQIQALDEAMKTVNAANLQGLREEIDSYTKIRETIAGLTDILKDMNTLTPEMHSESDFTDLIQVVERKMAE
jgi:hypothetical protein